MTAGPAYGWYGDDFTGATDTLTTIAKRGGRAFLFLSVPSERHLDAVGTLDAIGIAGRARAMNPGEMRAELGPVGAFFRRAGTPLVHYKCCSTFDSGRDLGNIATAIDVLRGFIGTRPVPVIGGQPSLGRYCGFSNLFAAGGGEVHRLDRHPTMSRHPATPMVEADLARHLQALGLGSVSAIHWPQIETGGLRRRWSDLVAGNPDAILLDALSGAHLDAVGDLLRDLTARGQLLVVGASSVAEAFFRQAGDAPDTATGNFCGPVLAFAGSQSPLTRAQVEAARSYIVVPVDPQALVSSDACLSAIARDAAALLRQGKHVLLSTVAAGAAPLSADPRVAPRSAALVDRILDEVPVNRLAVAGGDTSSAIVQALNPWGLGYHSQIASGITLSISRSERADRDGMLLMLKGGQMGGEDLFERFLGI